MSGDDGDGSGEEGEGEDEGPRGTVISHLRVLKEIRTSVYTLREALT